MQINILYIACRRSFNQIYICISSPYTRWPIKRRWCLYKLKWQLATPFLVAPTFDGNCKLQLTYACTLTSVCTRMYENIISLCVGAPIFKSCWCRCSSLSGITGNARKVHFNCPTIMLNAHAHMHTYYAFQITTMSWTILQPAVNFAFSLIGNEGVLSHSA